jgi:hypothetical protein
MVSLSAEVWTWHVRTNAIANALQCSILGGLTCWFWSDHRLGKRPFGVVRLPGQLTNVWSKASCREAEDLHVTNWAAAALILICRRNHFYFRFWHTG